jgi:hypothetical protein
VPPPILGSASDAFVEGFVLMILISCGAPVMSGSFDAETTPLKASTMGPLPYFAMTEDSSSGPNEFTSRSLSSV